MSPRPLRTAASITSVIALAIGGVAGTTSVAHAAPGDVNTTLCAGTPIWTGGFDDSDFGQVVHGRTTTHGITPEAFAGTYVDTLVGGAGRGKDILLFRMTGSRVTKPDGSVDAGIWAGMSGSPVYDNDDNLIGSVSYGFSGAPSNLAGVTPAADIINVDKPSAVTTQATSAEVPTSMRSSLAKASTTPSDSAADYSTIHPLTLPRVSVGSRRAAATATAMAAKSRTLAKKTGGKEVRFATAAKAAAPLDAAEAIVPGGNIATAWSYGDVTMGSVGTITAICGDNGEKVFAFGHPDDFSGSSTETFHAAKAVQIQEDSASGSYKIANIDMTPVGQITQDRLSGVMGVIGQFPATTRVTSRTTVGATTSSATTHVSVPAALGTAVGNQVVNDVIADLDQYSAGGEALMTWKIGYTPQGGAPATYSRTQLISTDSFFADQAPFDVASDVEFLQLGSDRKVTINSVTISSTLRPDYKGLRISQVDIRKNGQWVKAKINSKVAARKGKPFRVQVHLTPTVGSVATPVLKRADIRVATGAVGTGQVSFDGGLESSSGGEADFTISPSEGDGEGFYDTTPLTVSQVIAVLKSQPRNDSVRSSQSFFSGSGPHVWNRTTATPAVTSGSFLLRLAYIR